MLICPGFTARAAVTALQRPITSEGPPRPQVHPSGYAHQQGGELMSHLDHQSAEFAQIFAFFRPDPAWVKRIAEISARCNFPEWIQEDIACLEDDLRCSIGHLADAENELHRLPKLIQELNKEIVGTQGQISQLRAKLAAVKGCRA